jgi:hypothetical protein
MLGEKKEEKFSEKLDEKFDALLRFLEVADVLIFSNHYSTKFV